MTEVVTEDDTGLLYWRRGRKRRVIELSCTLKNVELTISQIFIVLDFSSVLT